MSDRAFSRREFLWSAAGSALALGPGALRARAEVERPNILFVLLDDLGAETLGTYGGTSYATPRLDALAAEGLRFENCYASPTCIPSRATALTGLYPFRTGLDAPLDFRGERELDPSTPTFAAQLRAAGYRTAVSGKWQLARLDRSPRHPRACGFDESFLWGWSTGSRKMRRYWGAEIYDDGLLRPSDPEEYGPDLYCDFLVDFMERQRKGPFLAYYPTNLVHAPFMPTPDDWWAGLAGYASVAGAMRTNAAAKLLGDGWFASMVAYVDGLVGRLVDALDALGLRERTLVLVCADNGTPRGFLSQTEEREIPGGKDTLTEAGTRVPLIASWPGHIEAGVADDLVDLSDLAPTFTSLAGTRMPAGDGVSLAPRLLQARPHERRAAFAQRSERWFVRDQRWRLHHDDRLFDLRDRYSERPADPGPEADAARARLAAASPMRDQRSREAGSAGARSGGEGIGVRGR